MKRWKERVSREGSPHLIRLAIRNARRATEEDFGAIMKQENISYWIAAGIVFVVDERVPTVITLWKLDRSWFNATRQRWLKSRGSGRHGKQRSRKSQDCDTRRHEGDSELLQEVRAERGYCRNREKQIVWQAQYDFSHRID
jgi:hypothetical protein